MCNSLFPVRAVSIAAELAKVPDVVKQYNDERTNMVLGNDSRTRLVLSSPCVGAIIRKRYPVRDFRARFSFDMRAGFDIPLLEVYDVDGNLITMPIPVSELDTELCDAVHIELLHVLLISKGLDINMY